MCSWHIRSVLRVAATSKIVPLLKLQPRPRLVRSRPHSRILLRHTKRAVPVRLVPCDRRTIIDAGACSARRHWLAFKLCPPALHQACSSSTRSPARFLPARVSLPRTPRTACILHAGVIPRPRTPCHCTIRTLNRSPKTRCSRQTIQHRKRSPCCTCLHLLCCCTRRHRRIQCRYSARRPRHGGSQHYQVGGGVGLVSTSRMRMFARGRGAGTASIFLQTVPPTVPIQVIASDTSANSGFCKRYQRRYRIRVLQAALATVPMQVFASGTTDGTDGGFCKRYQRRYRFRFL